MLANDGGKAVASYGNGTLIQWDAKNGMTIGKPMKVRLVDVVSIAMNEECGWILAAYHSDETEDYVVLWDMSTCEMVRKRIRGNYGSELTCAAVSSNGNMIVTGSSDGTLQQYRATTGAAKGKVMRGHKDRVICVAFSPNDEMIVSGSYDKSIIRWATANGEQIGNPLLHDEEVTCFSISGDGTVIVSISDAHVLCRWDAISGQLMGKYVSKQWWMSAIWTDYDGTKLVTWTSNRTITWWSVEPGGAIRETSTLPLSNDVEECAIDMNHGVAALGLRNGAVAFCDIHW